jgi:hypothetical protein
VKLSPDIADEAATGMRTCVRRVDVAGGCELVVPIESMEEKAALSNYNYLGGFHRGPLAEMNTPDAQV